MRSRVTSSQVPPSATVLPKAIWGIAMPVHCSDTNTAGTV